MDRGARTRVVVTLTVLSVPIVVINGVLYDRVGIGPVAVWLVLEAFFLTLTGVVIVRLPQTDEERGVSNETRRHLRWSENARSAYRTLQRDGQVTESNEGFDALIRLLNRGTSLAGGGQRVSIDGSARDPERAVIEVDGVPLDLNLARVATAVRAYGKRATEQRETERTRTRKRDVLVGTSVLVMSMLLQLLAVVLVN
jgi:hypothetical protein